MIVYGGTRNSIGNSIGMNNTEMIAHGQPTVIMGIGKRINIVNIGHIVLMQSRRPPRMNWAAARNNESRETNRGVANDRGPHRSERNTDIGIELNINIGHWMIMRGGVRRRIEMSNTEMTEQSQPMRMMDIERQINIGRIGMMQLCRPPKVKANSATRNNNGPQMSNCGTANDLALAQGSLRREAHVPTHLKESSTDPHEPKRSIDIDIIDLAIISGYSAIMSGGIRDDTERNNTGKTEHGQPMKPMDIEKQINIGHVVPMQSWRPPRADTARRSYSGTQVTNYGIKYRGGVSQRSHGLPLAQGHRLGPAQSGQGRAWAKRASRRTNLSTWPRATLTHKTNDRSLDVMSILYILALIMFPVAIIS